MVQQPDSCVCSTASLGSDTHQIIQAFSRKRRVRAEGDHKIELAGIVQTLYQRTE
jgi:hypothetical protein